jgi:hypothetical protein
MFISPMMIEPTTASFAVFLLSKTSEINFRIMKRKPFHYKKKICKWIKYNNRDIIDISIDELGDTTLDIFNAIIHINPNPSYFLLIYSLLLIIIIIL